MNKANAWIANVRKKQIMAFGGICEYCGSKENLEFHHFKQTKIYGRGRGRKERYYDVQNNKDCVKLLCHDCHKIEHFEVI